MNELGKYDTAMKFKEYNTLAADSNVKSRGHLEEYEV